MTENSGAVANLAIYHVNSIACAIYVQLHFAAISYKVINWIAKYLLCLY